MLFIIYHGAVIVILLIIRILYPITIILLQSHQFSSCGVETIQSHQFSSCGVETIQSHHLSSCGVETLQSSVFVVWGRNPTVIIFRRVGAKPHTHKVIKDTFQPNFYIIFSFLFI